MSYVYSPAVAETEKVKQKLFTLNLAQVAATYDLLSASGGDVNILNITFYNDVAAAGLTSVTAASNNTTPDALLAAVLLATLTGGKNLTPLTGQFVLASTKKIQYTIVGTGSAGTIKALVRYTPTVAGADLV